MRPVHCAPLQLAHSKDRGPSDDKLAVDGEESRPPAGEKQKEQDYKQTVREGRAEDLFGQGFARPYPGTSTTVVVVLL